jgi:ATP-binding protein involved in chromosome partitioning
MNTTNKFSSLTAYEVKAGVDRVPNIQNIIAITSGKGGVGKSTVAVNLAIALAQSGLKIGLLDCDVYGPSLPLLMGEQTFKPDVADNLFIPVEKYGIKVMSFGFLVDSKQPIIWRGLIVNKAIAQMLYDTKWGELDCLIIDLPPGTGDIHLTLAQKAPITAITVVTTPQDVALSDVIKSIEMFKKLNIPCLGVIENMSFHLCDNCGHKSTIFGIGASKTICHEYSYPLLAEIPLNLDICKYSDRGTPIVLENNNIAELYKNLANNLLNELVKLAPAKKRMPKINIESIDS